MDNKLLWNCLSPALAEFINKSVKTTVGKMINLINLLIQETPASNVKEKADVPKDDSKAEIETREEVENFLIAIIAASINDDIYSLFMICFIKKSRLFELNNFVVYFLLKFILINKKP